MPTVNNTSKKLRFSQMFRSNDHGIIYAKGSSIAMDARFLTEILFRCYCSYNTSFTLIDDNDDECDSKEVVEEHDNTPCYLTWVKRHTVFAKTPAKGRGSNKCGMVCQ